MKLGYKCLVILLIYLAPLICTYAYARIFEQPIVSSYWGTVYPAEGYGSVFELFWVLFISFVLMSKTNTRTES
jgi:hypothetical protein